MRAHLAIAVVFAALASPAVAQDAYVVGIAATLTGAAANSDAPAVEALRTRAEGRAAGAGRRPC